MAHFAEIHSETNRVLRVIVVGNDQCAAHGGEDSAECEAWVKSFHPCDHTVDEVDPVTKKYKNISDTYWKRTSVNTYAAQYWKTTTDPRTDWPQPEHGEDDLPKYFSGLKPTMRRWPWVLHEDQSKAFKKNYAVVGGLYHPDKDMFSGYKAHPSFVLDEETGLWWHSVDMPTITTYSDGRTFDKIYWNEDELQWKSLIFISGTENIELEQKWNKNTLTWEDI